MKKLSPLCEMFPKMRAKNRQKNPSVSVRDNSEAAAASESQACDYFFTPIINYTSVYGVTVRVTQ